MGGDGFPYSVREQSQIAGAVAVDCDGFVNKNFDRSGAQSPGAGGQEIAATVDRDRHDLGIRLNGEHKAALFEAEQLAVSAAGSFGKKDDGNAGGDFFLRPLKTPHRTLGVGSVDRDV